MDHLCTNVSGRTHPSTQTNIGLVRLFEVKDTNVNIYKGTEGTALMCSGCEFHIEAPEKP